MVGFAGWCVTPSPLITPGPLDLGALHRGCFAACSVEEGGEKKEFIDFQWVMVLNQGINPKNITQNPWLIPACFIPKRPPCTGTSENIFDQI